MFLTSLKTQLKGHPGPAQFGSDPRLKLKPISKFHHNLPTFPRNESKNDQLNLIEKKKNDLLKTAFFVGKQAQTTCSMKNESNKTPS